MIAKVLSNRFLYAPVSLGGAIRRFRGLDKLVLFRRLVETYFPGEGEDFPMNEPDKVAVQFCRRFSKAYFPIGYKYHEPSFDDLIERVPGVNLLGMGRYSYDSTGIHESHLLAGALVACPFEDADNTVLVEMFMKKAGEETASRLLPGGFPLEDIEEMLKDSPYEDLVWWCRWIYSQTGNLWLDSNESRISWDTETVLALAADYAGYKEIDAAMNRFNSRLGHGFSKLAAEILDYLEKRYDMTLKEILTDDGEKDELKQI